VKWGVTEMPPDSVIVESETVVASPRCVLHVGCGPQRRDKLHEMFHGSQWWEIRVDINPSVRPDIVASITAMPQVSDNSIDAVWSSHNLEHLFAHEVPLALAEFLRVLRPGGFALLTMPDLQRAAQFVAEGKLEEPIYESAAGPISAIDICFGHRASIARGNQFMAHKTGFSAQTLDAKLTAAGFREIQITRSEIDLWAIAYKR
jgi:SAM-dependent methyltransferase